MIQARISKTGIFVLLIPILLSCHSPRHSSCVKEGKEYCINSDWIYVIDWDSCYRRGVSCMEGECWENAIAEFSQAIDFLNEDMRNARPYGMHFRDYFPHREMGICYLHLGRKGKPVNQDDILEAISQLELSIKQAPSARAKYYLNQARRVYLKETNMDTVPPAIHLEFPEEKSMTNETPYRLKGSVKDDRYVASISIDQEPLFIELAEPSIPFDYPINLQEGWNVVRVVATDLVDRETETVIRIYLDQQGPTVIAKSIQQDTEAGFGQMLLSAFVYDASGIASFKLNRKEIAGPTSDKLLLIEEYMKLPPGSDAISFEAKDGIGNLTQGEFVPIHQPRRRIGHLSKRLASNGTGDIHIITKKSGISFYIKKPEASESETYYKEIFLEGRIESLHGIKEVRLNNDPLFDLDEILKDQKETGGRQRYTQGIINRIYELVQRYNIYFINRRVPIHQEITEIALTVKDHLGKTDKKEFVVKKIPRSQVFESERQMGLAIIPFDPLGEDAFDPELLDYIAQTIVKSFRLQERFDMTVQDKLPWSLIDNACKDKQTCDARLIWKIGKGTGADGVICGHIKRWLNGVEIKAEFRETEEGRSCLEHDVFTPNDTPQDLKTVISGLAMKFRDSFPVLEGSIRGKEGDTIYVDIGKESGIFTGMRYNVFKSEDRKNLITKASVKDVDYQGSEARIAERKKSDRVARGDSVRTR